MTLMKETFIFKWYIYIFYINIFIYIKVKESRNRPGVFQRVPGSLGSQIS